jgi:hypothetical protein
LFAIPLTAQKQIFSTYDWTQATAGSEQQFREVWADVKTPGGFPEFGANADARRTYAVGTIEVRDTRMGLALYSQFRADPHDLQGFFLTAATAKRQVVIVQSSKAGDNGIAWQTYLFGSTTGISPNSNTRAMNARAISVWEATDPLNARIAVCGETYDEIVPQSQAPSGWAQANASNPSGFISVLDGTGALRWSFHFFAGNDPDADCAITDLSIRVDAEGNEIVTYCGISSHGLATSGTTHLDPIHPFASPIAGTLSAGDTNQGTGQWDGFVGRLVHNSSGTSRTFHSIVGGPGTDGLFGLAEVDENVFAVVGYTETAQSTGPGLFPFPAPTAPTAPYRHGALLVFDARTIGSGLVLHSGVPIGTGNRDLSTIARDVCVGFDSLITATASPTSQKLYVVGSTNDGGFGSTAFSAGTNPSIHGQDDGFVCVAYLDATPLAPVGTGSLFPLGYNYWGGPGDDGLTGVNNWNEFSERIATVGWRSTGGATDIGVTSWLHNESFGFGNPPGNTAPPIQTLELIEVRTSVFGSSTTDLPAAMGPVCATSVGLAFDTFGLDQESGGGIAVGNDGRINAVGMSNGTNYPVLGAGSRSDNAVQDAVRTELDMVLGPSVSVGGAPLMGMGRTDGTGFQASPAFPPRDPSTLQVTHTGGTTPACALAPFGRRIGEPLPPLQRMLIDYEGNPPLAGSCDAAILVTRPSSTIGTAIVQLGLPPATPWLTLGGTDFWLAGPSSQNAQLLFFGSPTTLRIPLPTFPITGSLPVQLSVQVICLLAGTTTFAPGCTSDFTASPALFFEL